MCYGAIENEYHFLLECSQYKSIRESYIPKYYFTYPSYLKFKDLLTKKNTTVLLTCMQICCCCFETARTMLVNNLNMHIMLFLCSYMCQIFAMSI